MTTEHVKSAYSAEPFRPFVVHLADGRELAVQHREFMAMSPSGRTMVLYGDDDAFNVVDLLLVTDLEFRPTRNGERRKNT